MFFFLGKKIIALEVFFFCKAKTLKRYTEVCLSDKWQVTDKITLKP